MKAPLYRVGQRVTALSGSTRAVLGNHPIECKILYPNANGTYLAKIESSGGYVVLKNSEIIFPAPELPLYGKYRNRRRIRVVFFGNGQFALPTLKHLIEVGYNVVAVVTMPDKECGRGLKLRQSAVKRYAEDKGLRTLQPITLHDEDFERQIKSLKADIGVVVEFRILPESVYSAPKWGTINLHSSLLPEYRGASTIASAIRQEREVTGITTFKLDNNVDTGDIVNNLALPIFHTDTAKDVHDRLGKAGAFMVDDAILRMARSCPLVPQKELECDFIKPSYAPKLTRNDCSIPWWKPMREVYNFIRSISPVPGAWTILSWDDAPALYRVKIFRTSITDIPMDEALQGRFFIENGKLLVTCCDGVLCVDELQFPGRRRMTGTDFVRGYRGCGRGCVFPVE